MSGKKHHIIFPFILQAILVWNIFLAHTAEAQVIGNEWIVPGQSYYKIPVAQTGLYAVTFAQLNAQGVPASFTSTPQNMQLFHRGEEQAIYISNDTLVFYGQKNDGTLDSILYKPNVFNPLVSSQPHKYYNLYSDSTAYFLTWSAGTSGKRMANSNLISAASPEIYHNAEILALFNDIYDPGYKYSSSTFMTTGDQGEGWFGGTTYMNPASGPNPVDYTYAFNPSLVYSSGPQATLEIMLVGRNGDNVSQLIHRADILIGDPANPDLTFNVPHFAFHDVKKFTAQIPLIYLQSGSLNVTIRNKGDGIKPSAISLGYMKLTYAQTFDMQGAGARYFHTLVNASLSTIEISNPSSGAKIFDISDKNNIELVTGTVQGGLLKAVLSASSSGHKLYVAQPSAYLTIPSIKEVDLTFFSNVTTAEYIMVSNKKTITGAREYATYRASAQGGAYDTLLAEVDKLYNIYSYGERTPVAIKRFVSHLLSVGDPKYLFIIGKGLAVNYASDQIGIYYRKSPLLYINHADTEQRREDLVPCFGVPCSDLLYSMSLDGSSTQFVAQVPTGRLPAKTDQEVRDYLAKVVEHEGLNVKAPWRKHLIHLSGGNQQGEKDAFYNNVVTLKNIAEDTLFGGKVVKIFSKKGNDAVDNELITSVAEEINKGVSYVTFFGHSSPGITDLDIGFASHDIYGYENKGKYPMLFINGCSAAQMFARWSFAEDWILVPDRGAISILGHTDAGYANELLNYSSMYYNNAFRTRALLGKPVGDVQKATIESFNAAYGSFGAIAVATMQQMVLQGDPAVRVYTPELPDYETEDSKLSIQSMDNEVVTAVSGSFAIAIIVSNLGVDFKDSLQVSVRRTYNGKVVNYGPVLYKNISYMDTILFVIQSPDIATYGENIFEIKLDPNDSIPEIDELNNTATLRFFMPLSGVTALFPREYSIVSTGTVTLVAQSTNLLVANRDYFIEIDTSYLFDSSPLIKKDTIVNSGSLVKWKNLSLPLLQDSLVYYWRVRYNDIALEDDTLWGESSFIYIGGSMPGWSQSEFPQFFKDPLNKVEKNIPVRKWEFGEVNTPIIIKTVGNSYPNQPPLFNQPYHRTTIILGGYTYEYRGWCGGNSLFAIAFDKTTSLPYSPYPNAEGGYTCGIYSMNVVNHFHNLSDGVSAPGVGGQNQANLSAYIDSVPTGDYVILGNSGNAYFNSWTASLKNKIKTELGAKFIDSLGDGMPYILVARKGDPNPFYEAYDSLMDAELIFDSTLTGTYTNGYITSTLIGPAAQGGWGTFYRNVVLPDADDKYEMKIIGVDILGDNIDTLTIAQHDTLDLSTVAISQYPYIRLLAEVKDTVNLTSPQLKRWQVIYNSVPEGTMNPALVGVSQYNPITKAEGDSISLCYAFENIGEFDFDDTLQIKYTITNSSSGATFTTEKLTKLKKDSVVTFCHKFSTHGLQGNNVFQAYVNPKILREEYYNNNIIETSFTVEKDIIHPILDVVFDGVHIMDGDIVSPSPLITITLNDENPFLIRNSTEDMEVFLQKPGDVIPQQVDMAGSDIIAARQVGTNGKNVYQIEYNPKGLPNGIYTLVVRGKDLSENASGVQDYRISFEVINESTITNFYPYPNPFSTSTRFVFTLTGSEIPSDMKIQIMTVTGKVVREITKADLGHIRIGNNKTDFAWDGTDEFGDKLANGVYLYRVILKDGGDFKHRDTAGDKAFKKNFGKLYILR